MKTNTNKIKVLFEALKNDAANVEDSQMQKNEEKLKNYLKFPKKDAPYANTDKNKNKENQKL